MAHQHTGTKNFRLLIRRSATESKKRQKIRVHSIKVQVIHFQKRILKVANSLWVTLKRTMHHRKHKALIIAMASPNTQHKNHPSIRILEVKYPF
jgi:hypothetical protein